MLEKASIGLRLSACLIAAKTSGSVRFELQVEEVRNKLACNLADLPTVDNTEAVLNIIENLLDLLLNFFLETSLNLSLE